MLALLALLAAGAVLLRLLVGDGAPAWPDDPEVLGLRGARAASGAIVGASLALAGLFLQCLLRNPLASPDLLGLSAGAGLGVVVAAYLAYLATGLAAATGGAAAASLMGGLATLALVYALSQKRGLVDPVSLVLVGVVIGVMCGAASQFVQHLLPDRGVAVARWMLGTIRDGVPREHLFGAGLATLGGLALGILASPALDAAALDEDEARSVGVPLGALRVALFVASGVLTAGSVLLAGPVGFVGLICPHAARMVLGPAHRGAAIGSALTGAALVVLADAAVKALPMGAGRLPVGVLTTAIGGPMLIVLIRGRYARSDA